ncbi:MAG: ComEA family DNA-binding protein [Congregibacter sp.]
MALVLAQGLSVAAPLTIAQVENLEPVEERLDGGVNINTASAAELASALVGVGTSRADAIVRYREQFGPFESVDELSEVSGIGASTVEQNRVSIRIE